MQQALKIDISVKFTYKTGSEYSKTQKQIMSNYFFIDIAPLTTLIDPINALR